jgi:hypothetical protein
MPSPSKSTNYPNVGEHSRPEFASPVALIPKEGA